MSTETFRALRIIENDDKTFRREIVQLSLDDLPENDVLVRVLHSSLNYKDALSASGNRGVTRAYPHTPGIDAVGTVDGTQVDGFSIDETVLVTGYDLGMNTAGGFAEYICVPPAWLLRLPEQLTPFESMAYGTAGLTAGLCVHALRNHGVSQDGGEVLVTGATGGVGSLAVAILNKLGYTVAAVTGKADAREWLTQIGAKTILTREEATDTKRPMLKERWAGVVDTVGGDILATAIASTRRGGTVTACGLVQSPMLTTSVYPFILRGVSLIGVDSVEVGMQLRRTIWDYLGTAWKPSPEVMALIAREVKLADIGPEIDAILAGQQRGRVVVTP
jgi:putative YhdH/YhfP family quinone oxidoreductase